MRKISGYSIHISLGLFLLFFANVVIGSFGQAVFLSDIPEMLTLFAACIFFVIGILFRERRAKEQSSQSKSNVNGEVNHS